jgi:hypothetical protein
MRITSLCCLFLACAAICSAQALVPDPGPALPPAPAPTKAPSPGFVIRQAGASSTLNDVAQKVMFVKSDTTDPKAAIANVLLSDVGIHLLTMGLPPGVWNPYTSEAVLKAAKLGKGMLLKGSNDVKGFEFDTLPGLTAQTTFKPDLVDMQIPLDLYRPSADFSIDGIEPVLLRLETRPNDQMRILASRHVTIKEQKKGRFDLKPTSLREESEVNQQVIPVNVERQAGNILHVTTREPLVQGEYALVLRGKSESGIATQNIALKSAAPPPAPAAAPADPFAGMMGMQGMQPPPQQPQRKGLFGGLGAAKAGPGPKQEPTPAPGSAGFLAWDFRVIE